MYAVSPTFLDAILASERQVVGKVTIDYTDPTLDQSITASANQNANISYPAQTADSVQSIPYKWASLDGTFHPDGTWHPAPDTTESATNQMGWWGGTLGDASGNWAAGSYPTLTITFQARPIHSLLVVGDSARNEYPTAFNIYLYDSNNTLLHQETITGNASVTWSLTLGASVNSVTKAVLEIHSWSVASRQVKIAEFFTSIQETYLGADITMIDLVEEREVDNASVPVGNISANEIAISLRNDTRKFDPDNAASPLYQLLIPNRRIRAWLGVVESGNVTEWVPLGTFWSLDWQSQKQTVEATVVARDLLDRMQRQSYQSDQVAQNATLYTLAQTVLQDYGLTSADYVIDSSLQNTTVPYAWFSMTDHREALRIIAEAALASVYLDRDGILRIEPAAVVDATDNVTVFMQGAAFAAASTYIPTYVLQNRDYFNLSSPSDSTKVANLVQVTTQPLVPQSSQNVYTGAQAVSVPANGSTTVTITYNQPPVMNASAALTGAGANVTISSATYYAWGAVITLANSGAAAETATITITGQPLTVQGQETASASNSSSQTQLGTLLYQLDSNPLIQTLSVAQSVANALINDWSDSRRDLDMDWRGDPALVLGDRLSVNGAQYHVIRQEISWNGALTETTTGRRV